MALHIRRIHPVFVGEASGVDIARPIAADDVAASRRAWTAAPSWCSATSA
jgi:hypothetical protein